MFLFCIETNFWMNTHAYFLHYFYSNFHYAYLERYELVLSHINIFS